MKKPFDLVPMAGLEKRGWHNCNTPNIDMAVQVGKKQIWLNAIRVDPEQRGRGLGTIAMLSLLLWARKRSLEVYLTPEADNPDDQKRLEAWYKHLGFAREKDSNIMIHKL